MEESTSRKRRSLRVGILAALVLVFIAYIGNYHWIHGSGIALRKIPKVSWSLSETFINADEVKATPVAALPFKYPLFIQARVRDAND